MKSWTTAGIRDIERTLEKEDKFLPDDLQRTLDENQKSLLPENHSYSKRSKEDEKCYFCGSSRREHQMEVVCESGVRVVVKVR